MQYNQLYAGALGADAVELGFLNSIGAAASSIVSVPLGWAAEKHSVKKVMLLGLICVFMSAIVYALAGDWWILVVAVMLAGMVRLNPLADIIFITITNPQQRAMVMSLSRALTVAFLVSAFEEPMFRMFTSLYVFDVVGVSTMEWGIVNTAWVATTLVFGFPLGKVVDKIGRKRSILSGYCLFIPSTILFLSARSFPQLIIVYLMFGIGGCLIMPAYSALLADLIPKEKRGRIMGTIVTMNILATVPASAFSGFLYGASPVYPFILTIILGVAVSLIILFAVKEPETKEE